MVLTEGWDMPEVGCAILARPTKKMGLYRQMIGRVLRPADGKADAIILDHSGAVYRHGLAEDPVEWTLDPEKRAQSEAHQARVNHEAPRLLECSQCSALRLAGQKCPHCGFLPKRPPRDVPTAPGELGLYAGGRAQSNGYDATTRTRWHGMFTHIANERGYKPGWAAHKFKEKFGACPPWGSSVRSRSRRRPRCARGCARARSPSPDRGRGHEARAPQAGHIQSARHAASRDRAPRERCRRTRSPAMAHRLGLAQ